MRTRFQTRIGGPRWANFIKNPDIETTKRIIDPKKTYVAATH
jgi:hypothetical protein